MAKASKDKKVKNSKNKTASKTQKKKGVLKKGIKRKTSKEIVLMENLEGGRSLHYVSSDLEKELTKELKDLTVQIKKLKGLEFVKVLKRPWKLMWLSFLKGMMVGFGSVIGASVLVGILVYLLAQISFVPIVGDFIQQVLTEIQEAQQ